MEKGPSTFAEYWTSEESMYEHYDKHGFEMGFEDEIEYTKDALKFIHSSNLDRNIKVFKDLEGAIYKFHKQSRKFSIVSRHGKIVTYYKLEEGEKDFDRIFIQEQGIWLK